ncbi:MAG: NHL repeat-containing protein [Myxococcota bacterium]
MIPVLLVACAAVPSELDRPNRVAIGPDGTVYVSDFHHDRIVVFGPDGVFRRAFGRQGIGEDQLWRVTALVVDRDGTVVVANRRPESDALKSEIQFEIKRFDTDGDELATLPLDGRTLQDDGWVDAVVPTDRGTWVVADSTHGELVEIDAHGSRVGRFGGIPRPDAAPSALTLDRDAVWVVEQNRHRVTRVGPGGDERELVLDDAGHGLPRFPSALAVCPDQWYAIADYGNHRVQRYGVDGAWLGEFAPASAGPDRPVQLMDLAVSPACDRLYLVDSKGDRVLVTTPDGHVLHVLDRWP